MKIEQLTLENFKCFKSEKTFDFSRLTILTGANSSGKSSVINALLGILQSDFPFYFSTNGEFVELGDYREIVNNHDTSKVISINIKSKYGTSTKTKWIEDIDNQLPILKSATKSTLKSNIEQDNRQIDIETNGLKGNFNLYYKGLFGNPNLEWLDKLKSELRPDIEIIKTEDGISISNFNFNELIEYGMIHSGIKSNIGKEIFGRKLYDIVWLRRMDSRDINYISAFRATPKRTYLEQNKSYYKISTDGEGYIDQIVEWEKRSNSKIKELIKTMKDLDLIENIKVNRLGGGRFEISVKPLNNSNFSALSDVGSGVSAFMPIIVADLQLPDDSTLFLAEPEIHLHPSVQSKFGEYIVNQINNSEKNYVIETHSEYFLNRIRLAIVKGELKKDDVKVYFLENKNDDTDVYDIDFTKTGAIKNAPKNFFETYFADSMAITLNAVE